MQKVTATRKQWWFTPKKEEEPELGCTDERKTEANEKGIKNIICISGNRKNNNLKLEGMSGGKKK